MESVFEVSVVYYVDDSRAPRPRGVRECVDEPWRIGIATSLEKAMYIIGEEIKAYGHTGVIHSFRVTLLRTDCHSSGEDYLIQRTYDSSGKYLDSLDRTGPFKGLDPWEGRFKVGDFCEVLNESDNTIRVGLVAQLPSDRAEMKRLGIGRLGRYQYMVITNLYGRVDHYLIDGVRLFPLTRPVHHRTAESLREGYELWKCETRRLEILGAASEALLRSALEEAGLDGRVTVPPPVNLSVYYEITLPGGLKKTKGKPVRILIGRRRVEEHFDRVRTSLLRLGGKATQGRGFRLKLMKEFDNLVCYQL